MVWAAEGHDRRTHFGSLAAALVPALLILGIAAMVMFSVL